jgi:DNA-binding beta-propeller fold protein YncE
MPAFKQQPKRNSIDEQTGAGNDNGYQRPMRPQQTQRGSSSRHSADPYEDDLEFQSALSAFKSGDYAKAWNLVDVLLKKYPGDSKLEEFKKIIQQQMPDESYTYRDHPAYLQLRKHIKDRDWAAGVQAADDLLASYPNVQALTDARERLSRRATRQESRTRIKLVGIVVFLALILLSMGVVFARYIIKPEPLAEMLIPNRALSYPPHYLFSIYDTDQPVGVGLSQDGQRIYVAEMGGERMVRIFDREGKPLGSFTSPETDVGERAPVYVASDSSGQVYVSDRIQHAIFIFSRDGEYIDTLLGPELTLSEYVADHAGGQTSKDALAYNLFRDAISVPGSSSADQTSVPLELPTWSPLGIRISQDDEMILTDVSKNSNRVIEVSLGDQHSDQPWADFSPLTTQYGTSGSGDGEMLFPNSAAADSQGRVYVSDGNNRRISVWDGAGNFQFNFGSGTGPGSLSLPRGIIIDSRDRLYVVDTVAQNVKVYDVSGSQPAFLFEFGDFGKGDGLFNYPNDIAVDSSGRLYIADRENNRIEVWSY